MPTSTSTDAFGHLQDQVLHTSVGVMTTILKRAAGRGEARPGVPPRVATLPTDLFRMGHPAARLQPGRFRGRPYIAGAGLRRSANGSSLRNGLANRLTRAAPD